MNHMGKHINSLHGLHSCEVLFLESAKLEFKGKIMTKNYKFLYEMALRVSTLNTSKHKI